MRLFLTLLITLSTLTAFGQSRIGKVYLSGNTRLSVEETLPELNPVANIIMGRPVDSEDAVTWRAQSSRIGYFLTNRWLVGTDVYVGTEISDGFNWSNYFLSPFVRYYVTDKPVRKVNLFAQLGFGTVGEYGFGSNFETNFHLGAGAETQLADDVAASVLLRYNAQAWGLNYTELEFRLNAFLGGGLGKTAGPNLIRGGIMIDPAVGSIQLGHRGRDNTLNLIADLNVSGGYFLRDRVMVEAGLSLSTDKFISDDELARLLQSTRSENLRTNFTVGARYFPLSSRRLRPYISGRSSFDLEKRSETPSFFGTVGSEITTTDKTLHLQAGAGALFTLSSHLAIDAEVLYTAPVSNEAVREVKGRIGLKVFLPQ